MINNPSKEVNDFHNNDDVDSSSLAHHHTLGLGVNQAAPGSVVKDLRPVGEVGSFLFPPNNDWLLLDGSSFDANAYPSLAAKLGSTTLPDFRNRMLRGSGANAPGTLLGSDSFTLTVANLPSHSHGMSVRHIANTATTAGGAIRVTNVQNATPATGGTLENVNTNNTGSGTARTHIPASATVALYVKAR